MGGKRVQSVDPVFMRKLRSYFRADREAVSVIVTDLDTNSKVKLASNIELTFRPYNKHEILEIAGVDNDGESTRQFIYLNDTRSFRSTPDVIVFKATYHERRKPSERRVEVRLRFKPQQGRKYA